jgi:hypothetical protein
MECISKIQKREVFQHGNAHSVFYATKVVKFFGVSAAGYCMVIKPKGSFGGSIRCLQNFWLLDFRIAGCSDCRLPDTWILYPPLSQILRRLQLTETATETVS